MTEGGVESPRDQSEPRLPIAAMVASEADRHLRGETWVAGWVFLSLLVVEAAVGFDVSTWTFGGLVPMALFVAGLLWIIGRVKIALSGGSKWRALLALVLASTLFYAVEATYWKPRLYLWIHEASLLERVASHAPPVSIQFNSPGFGDQQGFVFDPQRKPTPGPIRVRDPRSLRTRERQGTNFWPRMMVHLWGPWFYGVRT